MKSREARSLQFDAPPIPKFLQALHSQVHGASRSSNGDEDDEAYPGDEISGLLGASSGRGRGAKADVHEDAGDHSGEEWDGAQIVVLKDGKHITETEAKQAAQQVKAAAQAKEDSRTPSIATKDATDATSVSRPGAGLPTGSKRRGPIVDETDELLPASKLSTTAKAAKTTATAASSSVTAGSMEDAKALIAAQREKKQWDQLDEQEKKLRTKDKQKIDKNKAAKKEKKKSGKGLSFDFQD